MNLEEGTCTLDGSYELTFRVDCDEANTNNCSLGSNSSDHVTTVGYKLKSENFCATISVDVGIVGKISSHENQTFVGSKSSFIVGRRVYYLVKVNSDLNDPKDPDSYDPTNPQKTIIQFTKTELVTVNLVLDNKTIVRLWKRGQLDSWGALCQSHDTKTPGNVALLKNSVGFSFVMTRDLASPPKNGKLVLKVVATVQVSYPNAKKRADTSDETDYESPVDVVEDDTVTDTTTPTTGTTTGTTPTTGTTTGTTATTGSTTTSGATTGSTTGSATTEKSNSVALIASLIMLIVALI
jgi:hypothetical protein